MLDINCKGTPYQVCRSACFPVSLPLTGQIGFTHGSQAQKQVHGSIAFYDQLFQSSTQLQWQEVRSRAQEFLNQAKAKTPRYVEEMQGIADGAEVLVADIMALNCRSEITFGLFVESNKPIDSDGCTSMSWKTTNTTFLSQNWDWMPEQQSNLIICRVSQTNADIPDFQMITEAGIIGKIGFNRAGVGCCFNAIRARGVDTTRMSIHFGLRMVLESRSKEKAIASLKEHGIAGSAHLLIGDQSGAIGLECSHLGFQELHADSLGRIYHANHYLANHEGLYESMWLEDSPARVARIRVLSAREGMIASLASIREVYKDEMNLPGAINRKKEGNSRSATLFNVVFDLRFRKGVVTMGRPTESGEEIFFDFD